MRRKLPIASLVSFARRDETVAVGTGLLMFGVSLLLGFSWLESAACGALAVPLWWRRRWPMGVLVAVTCGIVIYVQSSDPSPFFRPPLLVALYTVAARKWWPLVNLYLVTWGQNVCRPVYPRCGACVLSSLCPRIGVTRISRAEAV